MKKSFKIPLMECGPGWASLIQPLIDQSISEGATILQIKEKFGGLRFYVAGASNDLLDKALKAEADSYSICEICGAPGELYNDGWMMVRCEAHKDE